MDNYIKREDAVNELDKLCDAVCPHLTRRRSSMCDACMLGVAMDMIDNFPAAEVRENVRGEWRVMNAQICPDGYWVHCSVCGEAQHLEYKDEKNLTWKFCPNCGADMRGKNDGKTG